MSYEILVWEHKHGSFFYDASTPEAKDKAARAVVKTLLDWGYVWNPGEYEGPGKYDHIDLELANLTAEQIAALPTQKMRDDATKERRRLAQHKRRWEEEKHDYETALNIDNADVGVAWRFLMDRNGFEYEQFSLETVETFD